MYLCEKKCSCEWFSMLVISIHGYKRGKTQRLHFNVNISILREQAYFAEHL